ncbi:DNA polymerase III subunit alpha [Prevotella stercorea]|uniref:DNA polymerase III subunit alpha n=1 Tax=Leyella stercorea TaxID=363265 RepID=UPI001C2B7CA6|nr:DNA polymerase III subunit alpha [Leyella stercorea]MBU9897111.1 DNA polymerase III subunit alpha [Leyella stercorea]MBU9945332.1 DNA polymerase III subunit alpha [Leyella stercorea]
MEDFIHLHVHTYYSILDGQSPVEKLVDKAVANGMRGMAITDHGNMFGVKELFNYCNKINGKLKDQGKEPFKPIFGCEMYVARRTKADRVKEKGDAGGYHLIVLAKNYHGYKNLIKLVSRAWVDGFYSKPRTDRADLEKYHEDLIVCSACIAGEVPAKILKGDIPGAREAIEWHKRVFGDDYYLELQRHEVKDPNQRANRETFPLQQRANKEILKLAKEYGIKVVCTNDCHFVDQENAEAHDHLLCLSTGKELNDPTRMLYSKQEWFKTREEMNEIFSDVPEALSNTLEILDKVETYSIDHSPIMPFFPIPAEFGTEEDTRKRISPEELFREFTTDENGKEIMSHEEAEKKIKKLGGIDKLYRIKFEADYLAKLAYDGAKRLYGEPLSDEVYERVKFELHIMKTMGFPGYFLIVQDFINSAQDELGVMVGPGRGSAAGSVVAYCLGITKIDPIKYDLLFERFLNPDRISLPDIDTDFDDDGRGKVLEWVEDKYGHDKVAHIITYGTMATKNSIKDVARVEKLPLDISNRLCKAIPDKLPDGMKMNLTNAIKCVPELREAEASANPQMANTIKYAKMLEGTVRGTGIHACGTIICRDAISDWVPVSTAEDKSDPGHKLLATQYDGHVIEETGLIKMDFLGLSTLSIMKETVENIRLTHDGFTLNLDTIPIDDELTYKLYQEGRTIGTFQFESAGMQKYLRELRPTVFEDLIAMNALYRPGPMDYIPSFIARKNGKEPITYDIPCMEKYLKDTYGITVYQEQVMLLSRQLADFTRGESDALRKAMGKKKKAIVDAMKPKFIEGGKKNGHDPKVLEKIWGDWEKFASYAFNKSHATCYSWVAYQTAYLKAHYPAEFMAGNMSRCLNDITKITKLMSECQAMGIPCLGPDVNESEQKFSANKKGEVRFGLSAIKGMGEAAATNIIAERHKNGQYKDIFDFVQRVNLSAVNRKAMESLALSGGFDSFGIRREQYFAQNAKGDTFVETLLRYGQVYQSEQSSMQNSLFGDMGGVEIQTPPVPECEQWSTMELLKRERELVGIYLSAHPLDDYAVVLKHMCNLNCTQIGREMDKKAFASIEELTFGGIVTSVSQRWTKTNKPFGIVTIEDFEGQGELALFGEEWTKWQSMLQEEYHVYITAQCVQRFRNNPDAYDMVIKKIEFLSDVKEKSIEKFTVYMEATMFNDAQLTDLETTLKSSDGKVPLYINIHDAKNNTNIQLYSRNITVDVNKKLLTSLDEMAELGVRYGIN